MAAKKVVYLIGAGATQAEVNLKNTEIKVRMFDVGARIAAKAKNDVDLNWLPVIRDGDPLDIEQLVSLLISNGNSRKKYIAAANKLKDLYRDDIIDKLKEAKVLEEPIIAKSLLLLHKDIEFKNQEELSGIINLNHDNLFEVASRSIWGGINIGFPFKEDAFKIIEGSPIIIKLHGSFNWKCSWPIELIDFSKIPNPCVEDFIWLPPTTTKEAREFPYTKLLGKAYEVLMDCDMLRVIGCSLNQNDWNIINLIFSTQHLQYINKTNHYEIQFILKPKTAEIVKERCAYLKKTRTVSELNELDEVDGINLYKQAEEEGIEIKGTEIENVFKYWLSKKIMFHERLNQLDSGFINPLDEMEEKL